MARFPFERPKWATNKAKLTLMSLLHDTKCFEIPIKRNRIPTKKPNFPNFQHVDTKGN